MNHNHRERFIYKKDGHNFIKRFRNIILQSLTVKVMDLDHAGLHTLWNGHYDIEYAIDPYTWQ